MNSTTTTELKTKMPKTKQVVVASYHVNDVFRVPAGIELTMDETGPDWWVKWGTLHIETETGVLEIAPVYSAAEHEDWKRPDETKVDDARGWDCANDSDDEEEVEFQPKAGATPWDRNGVVVPALEVKPKEALPPPTAVPALTLTRQDPPRACLTREIHKKNGETLSFTDDELRAIEWESAPASFHAWVESMSTRDIARALWNRLNANERFELLEEEEGDEEEDEESEDEESEDEDKGWRNGEGECEEDKDEEDEDPVIALLTKVEKKATKEEVNRAAMSEEPIVGLRALAEKKGIAIPEFVKNVTEEWEEVKMKVKAEATKEEWAKWEDDPTIAGLRALAYAKGIATPPESPE